MSVDRRRRRLMLGSAAVATLGVAMLYVAGWYVTGDRVPNGTVVAGEDLGGLTRDTAEQRLERALGSWLRSPVELTHAGHTFEVRPAEAGLGFDVEETLSRAGGGRTWNPVRMAETLFGSEELVDPVLTVDEPALAAAVERIGDQINRQPVEPAVTFSATGEARIVKPRTGLSLDAAQTERAVVDEFLARSGAGILPVDTVGPEVDGREWRRAQRELVRPAVSGPIRLDLAGRSLRLAVRDYAPSLSFDVIDGTLTAMVDVDRLRHDLAPALERVATAPIDAAVVLRGGRPTVVPAEPGVTVDIGEVADAIIVASSRTGQERAARVEGARTQKPDFTTREARQLEIKEVVSSFVTYFPYAKYRNVNQARAAELINGTVLSPGELFSFNDTVGERTRANGFTVGFVIKDGVFAEDLGGGVSQVVTTTYNAAFFAGLEDVEHTPHSFYIDRYPMGREATVAWPSVDLKFRNNTPYGVLIQAWVVPSTVTSQGEMHVRMWSTKYWDIRTTTSQPYNFTSHSTRYDPSDDCVPTTGYGGFDVDVNRVFVRAGSDDVVRRETKHVSYTPADTVICGRKPR